MSDIQDDTPIYKSAHDATGAPPPLAIPVAPLAYAPLAKEMFFPYVDMSRIAAWVDIIVAFFALCFVVPLALIFVPLLELEAATPLGPLFSNVPIGVFFLAFVFFMLAVRRQSLRQVGLTIPSAPRFWAMLPVAMAGIYAAAIAAAIVFMIFAALMGSDETAMLEDKAALFDLLPAIPVWALVPFVLFVGLHEELLFRGFLLSRLRMATNSNVIAVIVTSIMFGLLHFYQGPIGIVQTTFIGAAMAIVTIYARTIWPAILAHAFLDGVNMSLMPLLQEFLTEYMEQLPASQPAILGG